jgi:type III pantothenate kinase
LPRVELARPGKVIGRNTITSMQAGLVYGYAGMVDALVERIRAEVDFPARCVATGGLAALIATEAKTIELTDELLTLKGLKLLFSRNHATMTT